MVDLTTASEPIKIVERRLVKTTLRKKDPKWRFALGARPLSEGLIVVLGSEDGVRGYGWIGEIQHLGHTMDTLATVAGRLVEGIDVLQPDDMGVRYEDLRARIGESRPVLAGIESAMLDLVAKNAGTPVHALFGEPVRREIPVLRILGIKTPGEMAANALTLVRDGYRNIKIKIDNSPMGLDIDRIVAVRSAVGPEVRLTLDANQSYDADGAIALYESVADQWIDVFEQPVAKTDVDGLRRVSQALDCIVEADESADSPANVMRLVESGACSGISLKLLKLGGVQAVRDAARVCLDAGVRCRLGAHVGSQLLAAAALQVAVTVPDLSFACELAEFARLDDDPFTGLSVLDGVIRLGDAPGLGVEPIASWSAA